MNEFKHEEQEARQRIMGRLLRGAREKAGLSQSDVARVLRFSSAQFVSNWERGVSLPPMDHLPKLVTILKIPQRTLIEKIHRYQEEMLRIEKRKVSALFAVRG